MTSMPTMQAAASITSSATPKRTELKDRNTCSPQRVRGNASTELLFSVTLCASLIADINFYPLVLFTRNVVDLNHALGRSDVRRRPKRQPLCQHVMPRLHLYALSSLSVRACDVD